MTTDGTGPWWASGATADDGVGAEDPFDAHRRARQGSNGGGGANGGGTSGSVGDSRWVSDAVDAVMRFAAQAGRHVGEEPATDTDSPHPDGVVCDACPVCIALRAVRQVRPEVIGHLSDAAHHLSLALRAIAEAQAGEGPRGFEHIDLDP